MAANNRQPAAAHERKQDRTHVSEGQRRASQAAEQRRRQAQAERERVERANEELRAKRRDRPDILDTSYQIEQMGGVDVEGQQEHAFVPFSVIERNYTENKKETNMALARGVRGSVQPHTTSLLIGDDGTPRQRDNVLQRMDPTYHDTEDLQRRATVRFAQDARGDKSLQRRWLAYRLDLDGVKIKGIAAQLGCGHAQAFNILSDARHYMKALVKDIARDEAS